MMVSGQLVTQQLQVAAHVALTNQPAVQELHHNLEPGRQQGQEEMNGSGA
jgi:hypothetical protein